MTREKLIDELCLASKIYECVNEDCTSNCEFCHRVMNRAFDEYDKQIRAEVIEECKNIVPFRIDDGYYSDGFNDCSKKVLDRMDKLKEQNK